MTGAGALPSRGPNSTRLLTEEAAANGLHAINLRYPNDQVLLTACGADGKCYESQRLATIYGGETDRLVVTRPNSIENRLVKVIALLHRQHPEEGWSQFLENDSPKWSAIVVAGWSQGGGHAALIARDHLVARVIMLEAPPDRTQQTPPADPAPWVADTHATPARRYFALAHLRSVHTVPFFESAWKLLGLDTFGPTVNVDANTPPYNRAHQLATNVEPPAGRPRPNAYHQSVAVDESTPRGADGRPVLAVVWQYMLRARPR
jgi:pimeloyl-ACP methyl ester carboxylesterase